MRPADCAQSRVTYAVSGQTPVIALLIDGMSSGEPSGEAAVATQRLNERFLALPPPISFTVDPRDKNAPALIERIREAGHEAVLRLPIAPIDVDPRREPEREMQPERPMGRAMPSLHSSLLPHENVERMQRSLDSVVGYVGVYAGPGAPITENAAQMKALLLDLKRERCLLVDGRSSNNSIVSLLAQRMRAPSATVSDRIEPDARIWEAFAKLERIANAAGPGEGVVLLGQAEEGTLAAIEWWVKRRVRSQTRLAPISIVADRPPPKRW